MTGEAGLGPDARARIAQAVARAEAGTSGEIVVMLSGRSGLYRSSVLGAALAGTLLLPWPLIALTGWSAVHIVLAQVAFAAACLAAGTSERLRFALMPRVFRRSRVRAAATRAFRMRGLAHTRGRTGVLLYIAIRERHAEIVTDAGVLARIPPEAWEGILADLTSALGRGAAEAGLSEAVTRIGDRLRDALPAAPCDPNELPDRVILAD